MPETNEPRTVTANPSVAALALVLLAIPATAGAQHATALGSPVPADAEPSPVRLELLGGSTAPLDVSIAARLVIVDRLILSASGGVSVYGDLFEAIATAYGDEVAGDFARSLANGFFVGRFGVGARPFDDLGLELIAGYTVLQRSATLDGTYASALLGDQAAAATLRGDVLIHALHGELGWAFFVLDHFVIRPAIGWTHAVASSVSLSAEGASAEETAALENAARVAEAAIEAWGFTPTLSLSIGYRF